MPIVSLKEDAFRVFKELAESVLRLNVGDLQALEMAELTAVDLAPLCGQSGGASPQEPWVLFADWRALERKRKRLSQRAATRHLAMQPPQHTPSRQLRAWLSLAWCFCTLLLIATGVMKGATTFVERGLGQAAFQQLRGLAQQIAEYDPRRFDAMLNGLPPDAPLLMLAPPTQHPLPPHWMVEPPLRPMLLAPPPTGAQWMLVPPPPSSPRASSAARLTLTPPARLMLAPPPSPPRASSAARLMLAPPPSPRMPLAHTHTTALDVKARIFILIGLRITMFLVPYALEFWRCVRPSPVPRRRDRTVSAPQLGRPSTNTRAAAARAAGEAAVRRSRSAVRVLTNRVARMVDDAGKTAEVAATSADGVDASASAAPFLHKKRINLALAQRTAESAADAAESLAATKAYHARLRRATRGVRSLG